MVRSVFYPDAFRDIIPFARLRLGMGRYGLRIRARFGRGSYVFAADRNFVTFSRKPLKKRETNSIPPAPASLSLAETGHTVRGFGTITGNRLVLERFFWQKT
jgi:hypothetical protein